MSHRWAVVPERLGAEQYLPSALPIRIDHHRLTTDVPIHWHEFYEMALIVAGRGLHVLNGVCTPLEPGMVFVLSPADFHALHPCTPNLELYNLVFQVERLSDESQQILLAAMYSGPLVLAAEQGHALQRDFERLVWEMSEQRSGFQTIVRGTLERIVIDIGRAHPLRENQLPDTPIAGALRYVQHHFREPLTLKQVAGHACLSPGYFSEHFHVVTGTTFQHYLLHLRLRFARTLLSSSPHLAITTVASAAGFQSLAHFDRTFKHQYYQTPTAYARQCAREAKAFFSAGVVARDEP